MAGSGGCGPRRCAVEWGGYKPAPTEHLPGPLRGVPGVGGPSAAVSMAGGHGGAEPVETGKRRGLGGEEGK